MMYGFYIGIIQSVIQQSQNNEIIINSSNIYNSNKIDKATQTDFTLPSNYNLSISSNDKSVSSLPTITSTSSSSSSLSINKNS